MGMNVISKEYVLEKNDVKFMKPHLQLCQHQEKHISKIQLISNNKASCA